MDDLWCVLCRPVEAECREITMDIRVPKPVAVKKGEAGGNSYRTLEERIVWWSG